MEKLGGSTDSGALGQHTTPRPASFTPTRAGVLSSAKHLQCHDAIAGIGAVLQACQRVGQIVEIGDFDDLGIEAAAGNLLRYFGAGGNEAPPLAIAGVSVHRIEAHLVQREGRRERGKRGGFLSVLDADQMAVRRQERR